MYHIDKSHIWSNNTVFTKSKLRRTRYVTFTRSVAQKKARQFAAILKGQALPAKFLTAVTTQP